MTPSSLALPVMQANPKAHRGDQNNRDNRCRRCKKEGHFARDCPQGGQKQGDKALAEQFKDLTAKAAGNENAARDLARELKEVKKDNEELQGKAAQLDTLKRVVTEQTDLEIDVLISDFKIDLGWVLHWRLLVLVLGIVAPLLFATVALGWGMVVFALFLATFQSLFAAKVLQAVYGGSWWWVPRRRIRYLRNQDHWRCAHDLRPDNNALQDVKHSHPQLTWLRITPFWAVFGFGVKDVLVSMEFVSQLTAPRFVSWANSSEQAFARMVRAAESYQWIQFSRWDTLAGRSVPMNSALVAWAVFAKMQQDGLVDFLGAPRL